MIINTITKFRRRVGSTNVQFKDGSRQLCEVHLYSGACLTGDPTAYVHRNGEMVWVRPVPGIPEQWAEA